MNKIDDLYYIEAVRKGDVSAFSFLVERYQSMVYSLALKLLKNAEDAEEMAQDTFIKAFQKLKLYEGKSKFSTWLYSITYNGCISELRKRRIQFSSLDDQVLVTLYYYESQSMEDISIITALTVSNIKVKIHRARKKMYELLHEMLHEEIYTQL